MGGVQTRSVEIVLPPPPTPPRKGEGSTRPSLSRPHR